MASAREPRGVAIIVCDAIYRDPGSGRRTLLGLHAGADGRVAPFVLNSMVVHVELTNSVGEYSAVMRIIDVDQEREPVVEYTSEFDCDDPLKYLELNFQIADIEFHEPGEYLVQFIVDDKVILERKLTFTLLMGN